MKKLIVIATIIVVGLSASWFFDLWNKPVEKIDELIGKNYDYALQMYFRTIPDNHYKLNVNNNLNEFDGGILSKRYMLIDSIVHVYT